MREVNAARATIQYNQDERLAKKFDEGFEAGTRLIV
jgi:hypothetical protein